MVIDASWPVAMDRMVHRTSKWTGWSSPWLIRRKGYVISPLAAYGGGHSPSSAQRGQQAGLCVAGVRQLDLVTERAAGMQEFGLRGDDVEARVH